MIDCGKTVSHRCLESLSMEIGNYEPSSREVPKIQIGWAYARGVNEAIGHGR